MVGRCLVIIFTFSLLSLPFITQLPTVADENLGIAPKSVAYGLLYGAFGMGAVVGALSIGTVFAGSSKAKLTRYGLLAFAGVPHALRAAARTRRRPTRRSSASARCTSP